MTPFTTPGDARPTGPHPTGEAVRGTARGLARRRASLLNIARRRGEIRVRVGVGTATPADAAETSELLDELNAGGWLRYGGLHRAGGVCELVYLPA